MARKDHHIEADHAGTASRSHRLSSPLGLKQHLQGIESGFDLVPFLDFAFIILLFGLLSSGIIFAPGYSFNLPESRNEQLSGLPATGVLSIRPNMILFDGAKRSQADLEEVMREYLAERTEKWRVDGPTVLLVKLDRDVPIARFLEIAEIAHSAGFQRVQVAASIKRGKPANEDILTGESLAPGASTEGGSR